MRPEIWRDFDKFSQNYSTALIEESMVLLVLIAFIFATAELWNYVTKIGHVFTSNDDACLL